MRICIYIVLAYAEEFATYLRYVRRLDFFEAPDYSYLKKVFLGLMEKNGLDCDWHFDWVDRQVSILELSLFVLVRRLLQVIVVAAGPSF